MEGKGGGSAEPEGNTGGGAGRQCRAGGMGVQWLKRVGLRWDPLYALRPRQGRAAAEHRDRNHLCMCATRTSGCYTLF